MARSQISGIHTEDLLRELIRRHPVTPGPIAAGRAEWPEAVVPIGTDESCYLTLHPKALAALKPKEDQV